MAGIYTETVSSRNTNLAVPVSLRRAHGILVGGHLDQLKVLRKRRGLTQDSLAEKLGVEQPTIQRWEAGKREPNLGQLIDLARVLGVEPGALIDPSVALSAGPRLFVKGEVAAGLWREAYELPETEWQTFTGRADVTAAPEHRFGLRVIGDSMNEIYPEDTIIECVSLFGHAEALPGKRIVVVRRNLHDEVEATVKELVEQNGELWCVPRSTNPVHAPFKLSEPEPGIVEVRIAAVVVASVRPE